MNRKRIIATVVAAGILPVIVIVWTARLGTGISGVQLGFGGHRLLNGQPVIILNITNGSSYHLTKPDFPILVTGTAFDGTETVDIPLPMSAMISCRLGAAPTKISGIAPKGTYRLDVPVREGPYTWNVAVAFRTIPLRERLPPALQKWWPSSNAGQPISFYARLRDIPPKRQERPGIVHKSITKVVN